MVVIAGERHQQRSSEQQLWPPSVSPVHRKGGAGHLRPPTMETQSPWADGWLSHSRLQNRVSHPTEPGIQFPVMFGRPWGVRALLYAKPAQVLGLAQARPVCRRRKTNTQSAHHPHSVEGAQRLTPLQVPGVHSCVRCLISKRSHRSCQLPAPRTPDGLASGGTGRRQWAEGWELRNQAASLGWGVLGPISPSLVSTPGPPRSSS